mgnify:CR=1 FL=1
MWTEQQNTAITRTELDSVFFPRFDELETYPSKSSARTAELFKPVETQHSAYIEQVFAGSPLFPKIGESTVVPAAVPITGNKVTTLIADFAQRIPLSKDLFDDELLSSVSCKF